MQNILRLAIVFFFCCTANILNAQITGKVTDDGGKPLPLINVAVIKTDNLRLVTGAVTDSSGNFQLNLQAPGNYLLRLTGIGFTEKKTEAFVIADTSSAKDMGVIQLKQDVKNLKDVTITAMRPAITLRPDRMIVSVEGSAMAAGNTAFSVLSKMPGVFIDQDGNIQLNGKGGVTVMLDGKLTYLSAKDLRNLLESMPAENLKNVEIITNPSAKYDAEGTSGILNINLKKNTQRGINGSVNAGSSTNFKQNGYSAGGNINYKAGNWNSFLFTDFARRFGGREATFTRVFYGNNRTTYFDQTAVGNFYVQGPPSVRLGADYNLNANHSVGFTSGYNTNTGHSEFLTDTYIGNAPKTPAQFIEANNYNENTYAGFTSNLHYNGKLDTNGKTLSVDFDFARIKNKGFANFYNFYTDLVSGNETQDLLYTYTPNGYKIYSAKFDYSHPLSKDAKFEMGAKASRVTSDNDFRFYFNNSGLVIDPLRTNHFYYKEAIYAGYVNWSGNLSKKLSAQAGLRAEQTTGWGKSFTTGQQNDRNYLDFFPSVFLQQKVSDNYSINYSYSRRLTRPNYGNLNPFRAYRDPYTWSEGNPYLRPQYTHSFSITQLFKKVYSVNLFYSRHNDVMTELPILDVQKNVTIYTTGNVDNSYNVGMTAIAPIKILKWWDTQNTMVLSYNKLTMATNNGEVINDQLFASLQSNHTIQLPLNVRMELNVLLRGPAASGLYHMAAMHRVDGALKRSFLNKKFDLSVNVSDIFKTYRFLWSTRINGNINDFDQYMRFRTMGVNLRYNFSKGQKVNVKQRSAVEELNRT